MLKENQNNAENELYKFFENITPSELSRVREKRKETSTRDKERLMKKVIEIEEILQKFNAKISIKKV